MRMNESRFDFWNRQTLREKPHQVLSDWARDRNRLTKQNEILKNVLLREIEDYKHRNLTYGWHDLQIESFKRALRDIGEKYE